MKTSAVEAALEIIRKQGRNGDTELAHVNPREKAILKALGGAGTRNPRTGLLQYEVSGGNNSQGSSGNGDFGGSMGGYLESLGAPTSDPTTPNGPRASETLYGEEFGPTAPPNPVQTGMARLGEVLMDPDAIPGFGIAGNLVGRAMSALGRQARSAYGPDAVADPTFEGGRQMEAFMGGPDFPGNLGTGLGEMRNEAFVPVANLLSRGLISDAGAPVQNPYVLPIEQQYASSVLGRPFANPADAAATYESIRGFL
jgi:hypothetical protein